VRVQDGRVVDVALDIFEPPRYFEALLWGVTSPKRQISRPRICGSARSPIRCPPASPLKTRRVVVDERIEALRRLLYCGEWIQKPRALHIYLLHAPDFLGCADAWNWPISIRSA